MPARFVLFKGISWVSRLVRFWTRSEYSHVGYLASLDGRLIEAWNHPSGWCWDFSHFEAHKPGTPYEVWRLPQADGVKLDQYFGELARRNIPWDLKGVLGFAFKCSDDRGALFCSEGCCEGLKAAGLLPGDFESWRITPVLFREILKVLGGEIVEEGVVG